MKQLLWQLSAATSERAPLVPRVRLRGSYEPVPAVAVASRSRRELGAWHEPADIEAARGDVGSYEERGEVVSRVHRLTPAFAEKTPDRSPFESLIRAFTWTASVALPPRR